MRCLITFTVYLTCLSVASSAILLDVKVKPNTGEFTITANNQKWFSSGETFLRANGERHSSADGTLLLRAVHSSTGSDAIGEFTSTDLTWEASVAAVQMITSIKQYESCFVFEQRFPGGAQDTSSGDADGLVSGFPTFRISEEDEPAGFAHWVSWYWFNQSSDPNSRRRGLLEAKGFESPLFGRWTESSLIYGGIGGSGVTTIFNEDASVAAVLSPLDAFMAASQQSLSRGVRSMGLMGNVTDIPAGYSMKSILYFGEGIQVAVDAWGASLLKRYNKPNLANSGFVESDISLSYLGYTTDNGAYYYYQTVPGKNYQDTIIDIKTYADSIGLPYRYILLDSWYALLIYYAILYDSNGVFINEGGITGEITGVSQAGNRSLTCFRMEVSVLRIPCVVTHLWICTVEAIYNQTGWLVQGHNRYWSDETVYAKQNGGKYDFLFEESTGGAVPLEQAFWDDFLSKPRSAWGLRVYEQDWLWNEYYQYVPALLTSVSTGHTWLQQMANGAEKNGLTIQYCMPHIRHVLQSVAFPVVTQVIGCRLYLFLLFADKIM